MAVVLALVGGWRELRSLRGRGWAMVTAAAVLIAVNWGPVHLRRRDRPRRRDCAGLLHRPAGNRRGDASGALGRVSASCGLRWWCSPSTSCARARGAPTTSSSRSPNCAEGRSPCTVDSPHSGRRTCRLAPVTETTAAPHRPDGGHGGEHHHRHRRGADQLARPRPEEHPRQRAGRRRPDGEQLVALPVDARRPTRPSRAGPDDARGAPSMIPSATSRRCASAAWSAHESSTESSAVTPTSGGYIVACRTPKLATRSGVPSSLASSAAWATVAHRRRAVGEGARQPGEPGGGDRTVAARADRQRDRGGVQQLLGRRRR